MHLLFTLGSITILGRLDSDLQHNEYIYLVKKKKKGKESSGSKAQNKKIAIMKTRSRLVQNFTSRGLHAAWAPFVWAGITKGL